MLVLAILAGCLQDAGRFEAITHMTVISKQICCARLQTHPLSSQLHGNLINSTTGVDSTPPPPM